jgi:predicted naringenin-chalcone synthase
MGIQKLSDSLLKKINKSVSDVAHLAIHPGGKKILEVIEKELNLKSSSNAPAYDVLRNYGNMSSPSVLFVLNKILRNLRKQDHDDYVLSFAFGPGLTLESMLLRIQFV